MATDIKKKSSFSVQDPHFFIVVMSPIHLGLKIPNAFMNKYRRELKDIVWMMDPTGVSWNVELSHYGESKTVWEKGWEEFAEYYSIERFFLLLFRYQGNSHFNVFIFDPSAVEIEYPVDEDHQETSSHVLELEEVRLKNPAALTKNNKSLAVVDMKMKDEVSIEILDELPLPLPPPSSSPKLITVTQDQHAKLKNTLKFHPRLTSTTNKEVSYKTVRDKSGFKSYERAKAFTSSNPFFISFMQPSFVTKKFYLEIPQEFVRRYLCWQNRRRDYFTLQVSGSTKKCWKVTVFFPDYESPKGRIVVGWKKFVEDHCLRVGDVCVFELVQCTKNMNVTIYSY